MGAADGNRTREFLPGKETPYHWATAASQYMDALTPDLASTSPWHRGLASETLYWSG